MTNAIVHISDPNIVMQSLKSRCVLKPNVDGAYHLLCGLVKSMAIQSASFPLKPTSFASSKE